MNINDKKYDNIKNVINEIENHNLGGSIKLNSYTNIKPRREDYFIYFSKCKF